MNFGIIKTFHHLTVGSFSDRINVRTIQEFLPVCCNKFVPIQSDLFEGIDCY